MIATRRVRHLDLAAPRTDGRPAQVSAASGLVRLGEFLHVVADDENELAVFPCAGGGGRLHGLVPGELPARKAERKARKADFEILLHVPGHGLLAMGSGSHPTRERAVLVETTPDGDAWGDPRVIDTAPLYARLREEFAELNLEGAALIGEHFVLLQRASRKDPRNALLHMPRSGLLQALHCGVFEACDPFVEVFDLGHLDGLPWTVTDAAALADGDLLVTAVIEDTRDSYEDGPCHGSALARVSRGGHVQWLDRLDTTAKVEGIAATETADGIELLLVTDADDASVPAELLAARVSNPLD